MSDLPADDAPADDPSPADEPEARPTDAPTDQLASPVPSETVRAIEAILMVADRPVEGHLLAQITETAPERIDAILDELAASYEVDGRGFILAKVAGGYRFQSHPDLAPYVERFVLEGQTARLSSAALETLAIVAYKQPLSRAQVGAIRGVNVDGVMRTLEQRGYIAEVGRDPGPGNPILFGTTDVFLEKMGLADLAQLPPIAEFMPGPEVVEALEHGLRAEPEPASEAETAAEPVPALEAEAESEPEAAETEPEAETASAHEPAGTPAPLDEEPLDGDPVGVPLDGAEGSDTVGPEPTADPQS